MVVFLEHRFRLFKQTIGWTTLKTRNPDTSGSWTRLLLVAHTQLLPRTSIFIPPQCCRRVRRAGLCLPSIAVRQQSEGAHYLLEVTERGLDRGRRAPLP